MTNVDSRATTPILITSPLIRRALIDIAQVDEVDASLTD